MKQGLTAAVQERDNPHQGMMPDSLHQAHGLVEILRAFRPESEKGYDSNARIHLTVIRELTAGVTGKETYIRDTLTVGDVSITIFRLETLTSEQVLDLLVAHYKAWCVNRP